MEDRFHYRGEISKVTPDGRSGVVSLDTEVNGTFFAVISSNTQGRVALMNGHGSLTTGTKVEGEAIRGVDALKAVTVEVFRPKP